MLLPCTPTLCLPPVQTHGTDDPDGVFGDRDANRPPHGRRLAPGCGLFGWRGDSVPHGLPQSPAYPANKPRDDGRHGHA